MATGYLIIYNIFQISVIQDIQSYGQLKTLGNHEAADQKDYQQTGPASVCGRYPHWPDYRLFHWPRFSSGSDERHNLYFRRWRLWVTVNPLIFIGSAIFAFVTVSISVRKPAKIAGAISPIEAIRYTENDAGAFQYKEASGCKKNQPAAQKFIGWALANLGRNRKRTILVIVSMTLSLVLFNTVFTLSSGFDIDKYVEKFLNKDFIISSADYFNYNFARSENILVRNLYQCSPTTGRLRGWRQTIFQQGDRRKIFR